MVEKDCILVVSDVAKRFLTAKTITDKGFDVIFTNKDSYDMNLKDVDYVIAGEEVYTREMLLNTKQLKMISRCGHGTDNIYKGVVPVTDCRGCLDRSIAEVVVGYIIMCNRHLIRLDNICRTDNWDNIIGDEIFGMTVGIIGNGGIGSKVSSLLYKLGVKVLSHDIDSKKCFYPLEKVLKSSDVITLHCDLNPSSKYLINDETIGLMKDDVVLINTSRGSVIKEVDLVKNISKFRYVVLDVFEDEPLDSNSSLLKFSNIILSTHCAGATHQGYKCMARKSLENICNYETV